MDSSNAANGKLDACQIEESAAFHVRGSWEVWRNSQDGDLYSFTMITTEANKLLSPIRNRMPAIVDDFDAKWWLNPRFHGHKNTLISLSQPLPSELMEAYEKNNRQRGG